MSIKTDEVGLVGGWKMLHSKDPEMEDIRSAHRIFIKKS
jgi:hypothetical protein